MISIERTKILLGDQSLSDEEAEEIRDNIRSLVEIIFNKWKGEKDNETRKKDINPTRK